MSVIFHTNRREAEEALKRAKLRALEIVGGMWESNAAALIQHPKALAPELRNSLAHQVKGDTVEVGSNMQVAPYIELGTGPNYQPPPEWLQNNAPGGKGQAGLKQWIYYDELEHVFKIGTPQVARPFLRPAFEEHRDEYEAVMEAELKKEQ